MPGRAPIAASLILLVVLVGGLAVIWLFWPAPTAAPAPMPAPTYPASRQSRPLLEGRELTYGTAHFLIHFTDEGGNAVPAADGEANGVPDYVERVGSGMEQAWDYQIGRLGFAPPPPDGGLGGDDRFDVYLFFIDYYGYNTGDGGIVGDNPLTPQREQRVAFSYLALDNSFESYYTLFGVSVYDALDITSAHEFSHSVQYGYDANEELWLMESTAALMEELIYPHVDDNVGYLIAHADAPDECLPRARVFYHPYSHWRFLKYLTERHPDGERVIPRIWAQARELDGLFALDAALDGALERYWGDWVVANLAHRNCPAGAPYCMAEAEIYPPLAIEGRMTPLEWDGYVAYDPPDGVGSFGVDYIELTPFNAARVPLDVVFVGKTPGVRYAARLVGFTDSAAPEITPIPLAGDPAVGVARFDARQYRRLVLTVENRTPALEANCGRAQGEYSIVVTRPGARPFFDASSLVAPSLARPGQTFDAVLTLRSLIRDEPGAVVTVTLPAEIDMLNLPRPAAGSLAQVGARTVRWQGPLGAEPLMLTLPLGMAGDALAGGTFEITAAVGSENTAEEFTLSAGIRVPQPVLLVDDAGYESHSRAMRAALAAILGTEATAAILPGYDVWSTVERGSPTAEVLGMYSTVIWNTGMANVQTLVADDRAALSGYLAAGGRLILLGSDVVFEQALLGGDEARAFLSDTLRVEFAAPAYQLAEGAALLSARSGQVFELTIPASEPEVGGPPDVIAPVAGRSAAWLRYPDGRAAAVRSTNGQVTVAALDLGQVGPDEAARRALVELMLGQEE